MFLPNGPWVIANQYLAVQRWKPNFMPGKDVIQSLPVWVRLSKLLMEWMDYDLLWNIGGMLGKICKVDPITVNQARGRFARICVEVDISKLLLGTLYIENRTIRVEYENLGLVCFKCGRYGHSKENCREGMVEPGHEDAAGKDNIEVNVEKDDSTYGMWLMVSYDRQGNNKYKGRNGRIGSNSSSVVEKKWEGGKSMGDSNVKKYEGISVEANLGKNIQLKNGMKARMLVWVKILISINKYKGKSVLFEITNQRENQGEKVTRNSSQGSKKILKKGTKLATISRSLTKMVESCEVHNPSKSNTLSLKTSSNAIEEDMHDSDNETKQLHVDLSECNAMSLEGPNQKELSTHASHKDNSFDVVASKLEEFKVLAILKPRISGSKAMSVINKLGFTRNFVVDAKGFSRGIWLLWNEDKIKHHVVASSRHNVTALIDDNSTLWVLTVVYVNPCTITRRLLWNYLDSIRNCFSLPWLVAGDFIEITNNSEKRGGRPGHSISGFADWIDRNELVDMCLIGSKFT
ncbi:hypothetical protein Dsin_032420 [Dipteronia sinensis]|uniref:CCHC-type domain-containing protein n=1 Tax=Dipteronia sinensis TaxID=43782 RepID=A0AAE0DTA1_9ROSI|nr:hypothetical protein Dsin_032420 [Dipteronia sinensis]